MTVLYWNKKSLVNGAWATYTNNWWLDLEATVQAPNAPTTGDFVYITGDLIDVPTALPTLALAGVDTTYMTSTAITGVQFGSTNGAQGGLSIQAGGSLNIHSSNPNGYMMWNGYAVLCDNAVFSGYSRCCSVVGSAIFKDYASMYYIYRDGGSYCGTIKRNGAFYGNSYINTASYIQGTASRYAIVDWYSDGCIYNLTLEKATLRVFSKELVLRGPATMLDTIGAASKIMLMHPDTKIRIIDSVGNKNVLIKRSPQQYTKRDHLIQKSYEGNLS